MNRAILIVICDFLMSSMLSMMIGMVPAHHGGTGVGMDEAMAKVMLVELENRRDELLKLRSQLLADGEKSSPEIDAQMEKLIRQIAEIQLKREKLESLQNLNSQNSGELSRKDLAAQLDAEKLKRLEAQIRLEGKDETLDNLREALKSSRSETEVLRKDVAALSGTVEQVTKLNRENSERLAASGKALDESRRETQKSQSELAAAKEALRQMTSQAGEAGRKSAELNASLQSAKEKLELAEKRSAEYKLAADKLGKEIAELRNAGKLAQEDMARRIRQSEDALAAGKAELAKVRNELTASQKIAALQQGKLEILEKQLEVNVFEFYRQAVVKLERVIGGKQVFSRQDLNETSFLPLVRSQDKILLIGALDAFAGSADAPLNFKKIDRLVFRTSFQGKEISSGAEQIFVSPSKVAAMAIELPPGARALDTVSASDLVKRGVAKLYLFKSSSPGKESTELGERCALDFSGRQPALIIRNSSRGIAEVKASVGDIVMTAEGKLAGIVVEVSGNDRIQEAKAALFDGDIWKNAQTLSLKADGNGNFQEFGDRISELRKTR